VNEHRERPSRRWGARAIALRIGAVLVVGIPVVAYGAHEAQVRREKVERMQSLARQLLPLAARHPGARRLFINGSPVSFGTKTSKIDVAASLDAVRRECESGERRLMLGLPAPSDEPSRLEPAPRLTRVDREEDGAEAGAVMCTFAAAQAQGGASDTQIRFSLAHRVDATTTSVFTIATETQGSLESLFTLEGDAPGSDLAGVPRPHGSRRDFSATFEGEAYGVVIYEVKGSMTDAVARYDAQMGVAGWKRSDVVAGTFPDARAYARDGLEIVASFEAREGVTFVTIAPLEPRSPAPR
jgi:hypothetical protein